MATHVQGLAIINWSMPRLEWLEDERIGWKVLLRLSLPKLHAARDQAVDATSGVLDVLATEFSNRTDGVA